MVPPRFIFPLLFLATTVVLPLRAESPSSTEAAASTEGMGATSPLVSDPTGTGANQGSSADLRWPVPVDSPGVNDEGKGVVTHDEGVANLAHAQVSLNAVWTILCGLLALLAPIGLVAFQIGLAGGERGTEKALLGFLGPLWAVLAFWAFGFALLFGGYGALPAAIGWQPAVGQGVDLLNREFTPRTLATWIGHPFGLWGYRGFGLAATYDTAVFTLFFFQAAALALAAAIPVGTLTATGRWGLRRGVVFAFGFVLPYALFGNWVWGGGWLAQLGVNYGVGHGFVDFGGGAVIHLLGGIVAGVGALVLGTRGKEGEGISSYSIYSSMPLILGGAAVTVVGWIALTAGATFSGNDLRLSVVAVNTLLSGAAGAAGAALYFISLHKGEPSPVRIASGVLAGFAAAAASAAFVNAPGAVLIGLVSGFLASAAWKKLRQVLGGDVAAGTVAVHGLGGAWGVLAVGLFADGSYGQGWGGLHSLVKDGALRNLVNDGAEGTLNQYATLVSPTAEEGGWSDQGVTGVLGPLFGGNQWDGGQLIAQLIGLLAAGVLIGGLVWSLFRLFRRYCPNKSIGDFAGEIEGTK
ncbi:ammonium transporter [Verrucomicrobium sp. GAS474]|uniref:hypothetical protein n=1 Tax=Verrucomicrobium sp. GAS474 TaxID=1882831 RepID=UPI00087DD624|nr:hypothetical protein [Verrucomicrobium sp. GAS474]SDT86396.1 ammonium transporter [Verrucomicrobium sp. GAS474]